MIIVESNTEKVNLKTKNKDNDVYNLYEVLGYYASKKKLLPAENSLDSNVIIIRHTFENALPSSICKWLESTGFELYSLDLVGSEGLSINDILMHYILGYYFLPAKSQVRKDISDNFNQFIDSLVNWEFYVRYPPCKLGEIPHGI